jgi:H+/Cl- antiporter ClcA
MPNPWRKFVEHNNLRRDAESLRDLTVRYVQEETIDPVKDLGRYAAFGCLGSFFVGLGSLLLLVGVLRILQTETGTFQGNLSWVPYLIVILLGLGILALVAWRIASGPAQRRLPKPVKADS